MNRLDAIDSYTIKNHLRSRKTGNTTRQNASVRRFSPSQEQQQQVHQNPYQSNIHASKSIVRKPVDTNQTFYRWQPLKENQILNDVLMDEPQLPHYMVPVLYVPHRIITNEEIRHHENFDEIAEDIVYQHPQRQKPRYTLSPNPKELSDSETEIYSRLMNKMYGLGTPENVQPQDYPTRRNNCPERYRQRYDPNYLVRNYECGRSQLRTASSQDYNSALTHDQRFTPYVYSDPQRPLTDLRSMSTKSRVSCAPTYGKSRIANSHTTVAEEFLCSTDYGDQSLEEDLSEHKWTQTRNNTTLSTQTINKSVRHKSKKMPKHEKEPIKKESIKHDLSTTILEGCEEDDSGSTAPNEIKTKMDKATVIGLPATNLPATGSLAILDPVQSPIFNSPKLRTHSRPFSPRCSLTGVQ